MFWEIVSAINQALSLLWEIIGYSFAIFGGIAMVLFVAAPSQGLFTASAATVIVLIFRYIQRLLFQYVVNDQDNTALIKLQNKAVIQMALKTGLLAFLLVFAFRLFSFIP